MNRCALLQHDQRLHGRGPFSTRKAAAAAHVRAQAALQRDSSRRNKGLILSVCIAALGHLALVLPAMGVWISGHIDEDRTGSIRAVALNQRDWEQNRRLNLPPATQPDRRKDPERLKKEQDPDLRGQVVKLPKHALSERPERADHLA